MTPIIAAHRGGAALWPENSMTAFRGATALAVDQIETDVRLSSDGEPFILHDATLDRTTEGNGIAADLSWSALSRVRLKRTVSDTIPHLDEVLRLLAPGTIDLRLELKVDARGEPQVELMARVLRSLITAGMHRRTTITSFDLRYLADAAAAGMPNRIWLVQRALAAASGAATIMAEARAAGVPEIAFHVSQAALATRAERGANAPRIGFYAVNDLPAIDLALALPASAFTTDLPDLAIARRAERALLAAPMLGST
jgi:glycerophosphoryl diester phosphodiesterase